MSEKTKTINKIPQNSIYKYVYIFSMFYIVNDYQENFLLIREKKSWS